MKLSLIFILAYLIGSFPSGVIIGRVFCHKDPRDAGSHNIGTTNSYRVLGPIAGTAVLFLDILKGTLAASLPMIFHIPNHALVLIVGLAAVVGHAYSIFLHFTGGKAVATSAGILLAYNPLFFVIASTIFISVILITSMVSMASILGPLMIAILSFYTHDWLLGSIATLVLLFLVYRHRENLQRIKNGTENLVPFGLYYRYKQKHR
ncbi:glycerol-3-phosphate 1-O-acyltransferase PlsY [Latilactobacillus curvatus]|uniref:glycerol-3-phosphate 1-O-acyltransferase PlsY n=1 Tax=Latilactobacillus curvatus TaxID=28038 RepID=UPI000814EC6E|nr:glycerol-3-phosphate 1-O-acyltransferase PlsY [Latilactobacillus curvatus]ANY13884.1 acyl-phosphate glycerol 3-phosphate acyltransferase [Latilactobacillus curvatus]MCM0724942.1 glycerol-3-phosphate 1-O-acyltransferase PlsY [Latilactobacillus curvatus]MCP8861001.1 glycerol-3-phosphate 1-O-acyltransferase PlsY [Latilactobacillus curvatus]MCP8867540.1 glycerol-3-phosphate 1-O-acyltransferase PlsY [Latilactobacillus curvatus]MCP8871107.1 glycerol-3-phosphate 1-O-acyltransferase PlsY [Latilacto